MLSTDQRPEPLTEIKWHAERCARGETTAIATTRILSGLTRGKSVVAFYGNSVLKNKLLGYGTFAGYARSSSPRGKTLLAATELYRAPHRPAGLKGVIELIGMQMARSDETLDSLRGILEGGFEPLSLATIPSGPARLQIYFSHQTS
jgi:hypothetical protein